MAPLDWEDELPDDDCDLSHAHSMFSELRLLSFLTTDPNRLMIKSKTSFLSIHLKDMRFSKKNHFWEKFWKKVVFSCFISSSKIKHFKQL